MKVLIAYVALLSSSWWLATATDKKDPIYELEAARKLTFERSEGKVDKPIVIESAADLEKLGTAKELQELVRKKIDFTRPYGMALVFAWSGSSGDKLTWKIAGNRVIFEYAPGFTDDVKHHVRVFALVKKTAWEVKAK